MKHSLVEYCMIVLLVVIVALSTVQTHAKTEQTRQVTTIQDMAPVGLVYGQSLRINALNPLAPAAPGEDDRKYKAQFAITLFNENGGVIARSDEITLDPGEFHSFVFNRADLPLAGEHGTGRLQMRGEVRRRFFPGITSTISQGESNNFRATVEIVDNGTGKTLAAILLGKEVSASQEQYVITSVQHAASIPSGLASGQTLDGVTDSQTASQSSGAHVLYQDIFIPVGLAQGQTLRYTWTNLNDPDPQKREFEPLRIRVRLLDAVGIVIAQTEAAAVGAGKFQSFEFNREQINLPGEPGAGRLQARMEVTVSGIHRITDITLKRGVIDTFDDAAEVIDTLTGQTIISLGGGMNGMILNDSSGKEYQNPKGFQIISAGKDRMF